MSDVHIIQSANAVIRGTLTSAHQVRVTQMTMRLVIEAGQFVDGRLAFTNHREIRSVNPTPLIAGNRRPDDRQAVAANLSILNDEFSPDTRQHGLTPASSG